MVIRDVVTRWNYTHAMIDRAQLLRKVCYYTVDFPCLLVIADSIIRQSMLGLLIQTIIRYPHSQQLNGKL